MSDELERLRERVAKLESEIEVLHALMRSPVGWQVTGRRPNFTHLDNGATEWRRGPKPPSD